MPNIEVKDHFVRKLSYEHTQTQQTDRTIRTTNVVGGPLTWSVVMLE